MSANRFYYTQDNSFTSGGIGKVLPFTINDDNEDDDDVDKDDVFEFMQDVPYSSSSVDRSSIGSIPWADDAIKQNQLDWELVERMLSGEETLPEDPELRNEIQEWQYKFPHLVGGINTTLLKQQSFNSSRTNLDDTLDIDSISNLSLNSLEDDGDDDDKYDGFATPTEQVQRSTQEDMLQKRRQVPEHTLDVHLNNKFHSVAGDSTEVLDRDLRISSIPLTIRQRQNVPKSMPQQTLNRVRSDSLTSSVSSPVPPTPPPRLKSPTSLLHVPPSPIATKTTSSANVTHTSRLRMPPILNVLETTRRFRGLTNNRSFVQLTQVQQAKSAALTHQPPRRIHAGNQSAWQLPLAAATISSSFFNNRNSIILPAINLQRIHEHTITTSTTTASEGGGPRSLSNTSLGSGGTAGRRQHTFLPQHNFNGATTTSTTTPSTGRSISAAVRHPRMEFSAFYLPYSASKFKAFK